MVNFLRINIVAIFSAVLLTSSLAGAQVAVNGGSGLYTVEKAGTLGNMTFAVGGFYTYDNFGKHGLDVDETAITGSVTLGIGDTFEVSAFVKNSSYDRTGRMDIHTYFPYVRVLENGEETVEGLTDSMARAKWNFYSSSKHNIDMAVEALVTLPIGDVEKGLGTDDIAVGGMFLIDKNYEDVTWHLNLGYLNLDHPDLGLSPIATYGSGLEYFVTQNLSVMGEVSGYAWTDLDPRRDDGLRTSWGARYYGGDWGSLTAGYAAWTAGQEPNQLFTVGATLLVGGKGRGPKGDDGFDDVDSDDGGPTHVVGDGDIVIVLDSVHFAFNKALLTGKAKGILRDNARELNDNPNAPFSIEGNTCSIGDDGYNYQLGLRRAIAVKKFLIGEGVEADRMMIISYGEARPKDSNDTRTGRSNNRRVDFVIEVQ